MNHRGAMAVEYALVLPVVLLFILGIADCGRLLWTYATLYHATEAAARCGAIDQVTCATTSQIKNYAVAQSYGLTIDAAAFTAATAACGMSVSVQQTFVLLIPWFAQFVAADGPSSITLRASACYPT
jgi:Flp pilus assembly protein TadG